MQRSRRDLFQGVIALLEETSEMIRGRRPSVNENALLPRSYAACPCSGITTAPAFILSR